MRHSISRLHRPPQRSEFIARAVARLARCACAMVLSSSAMVLSSSALVLSACALVPIHTEPIEAFFDDASFTAPAQRIDPAQVLAISPAMRAHLHKLIAPKLRWQSTHTGLIDALYTQNNLKLEYDGETTRNAAEAFEARAGNCLSLVLMTAAFARELQLPVRFQSVQAGETWGREGDLLLFVGHVNIAIGSNPKGQRFADLPADWVTVDFLPSADLQRQRSWPIDEARILAMYMNNRAAESLARGAIDDAYAWTRAALAQDRSFSNAWNTLGVIYLRHAQPERAEAALNQALRVEPDNPHTLSNRVLALRALGRYAEAQQLAAELQRQQPSTPFASLELGQMAMRRGDYALARRHFEQAVKHGGDYHEFHFALAQALLKLGHAEAATAHLQQAQAVSGSKRLQAMYAGKLERLRGSLLQ